jgi:hypothetical protein
MKLPYKAKSLFKYQVVTYHFLLHKHNRQCVIQPLRIHGVANRFPTNDFADGTFARCEDLPGRALVPPYAKFKARRAEFKTRERGAKPEVSEFLGVRRRLKIYGSTVYSGARFRLYLKSNLIP